MSKGGSYEPAAIEPRIYAFWERGGWFHADPNSEREPFTIVIPPPNVTGALHLGHAINNTLQDILIRQKRMQGYNACWLPGTDHAGIATQAVVERRVRQEEGKTRHELGREGLVEKIWAWKEDYNQRILNQLRAMGCSCDWERTRFTLDNTCARAVFETFFRFFKDGLIYRGQRLVNWDTQLQTAVADDEVYHETVKGSLWHLRYPVLEGVDPTATGEPPTISEEQISAAIARATSEDAVLGRDYLVCATTRPETMLGDTAVAVHPDDERYAHLQGRFVLLGLQNRPIPVIADGQLVKREFGTGCVKVTPGHDPNDYMCGLRHGLPLVNILNPDGTINELGGSYSGLERYKARKQVVEDLETAGLLDKIEPYETEIGHSDRSKSPIEPFLSEQWFVAMERLAEPALEAVRDGRVRFFPERYAKSYLDWLSEKRDWCISRQLWWGHRIPVWRLRGDAPFDLERLPHTIGTLAEWIESERVAVWVWGQLLEADTKNSEVVFTMPERGAPDEVYVCVRDPNDWEAVSTLEQNGFEQDPDVLDTWFSSALWPHSTFGWPGENGDGASDARYFYPTNVLSTARDIISLWVARMVMTGLYNVGRVPFQHVCIHPTILDGQGQRMSKTKGNGVNPLDLIQIYGADGMRFSLASTAGETQDVRVPVSYLCPHCGESFAQKAKHLSKEVVSCPGCKRELATRLADDDKIEQHGLALAVSERFELGRNLCNKLWQAATGFILPNAKSDQRPAPLDPAQLATEDHWILSRLSACIAECDRRLARYQYSDYTNALYNFFWSEFCDWYIELAKPRLASRNEAGENERRTDESAETARRVLAWVLDQTLRLMHPVMPFITEALWEETNAAAAVRGIADPAEQGEALIVASWPDAGAWAREERIEREMQALQDVIRSFREIKTNVNKLRAAAKDGSIRSLPSGVVRAPKEIAAALRGSAALIQRLGSVEALEIGPDVEKPAESASKVLAGIEVFVPLSGLADLEIERKRLRKERDELAGHVMRVESKLSNDGFVSKAPPAVVDKERARLEQLREQVRAVERNLDELGE